MRTACGTFTQFQPPLAALCSVGSNGLCTKVAFRLLRSTILLKRQARQPDSSRSRSGSWTTGPVAIRQEMGVGLRQYSSSPL